MKNRQLYAQIEEEMSKNERFAGLQKTLKEYESRFSLIGKEIERLNLVLREKTDELNTLGSRYRELEFELQRKDSNVKELQSRVKQFEVEMHQYQMSINEYKVQIQQYHESKTVINDYEGRVNMMSQEINRLNDVLKKKVEENGMLVKRNQEFEF